VNFLASVGSYRLMRDLDRGRVLRGSLDALRVSFALDLALSFFL